MLAFGSGLLTIGRFSNPIINLKKECLGTLNTPKNVLKLTEDNHKWKIKEKINYQQRRI